MWELGDARGWTPAHPAPPGASGLWVLGAGGGTCRQRWPWHRPCSTRQGGPGRSMSPRPWALCCQGGGTLLPGLAQGPPRAGSRLGLPAVPHPPLPAVSLPGSLSHQPIPEDDGHCTQDQACPLPVAGLTHTCPHTYALCMMLAGSLSPSPILPPPSASAFPWGVGSEPPPFPSPPALVSPPDKEQPVRILVPL